MFKENTLNSEFLQCSGLEMEACSINDFLDLVMSLMLNQMMFGLTLQVV